jgi:hypothetical protein
VRNPIPNNIIPQSQLDPVGVNLMNLYPTPNQPGTRDFQSNYYRSGKALEDYWAFITRIDHAFSERHRMFFRLHRDFCEEDKNRAFNNDVRASSSTATTRQWPLTTSLYSVLAAVQLPLRLTFQTSRSGASARVSTFPSWAFPRT